jgi:c-di-GMP-binding flagellar brake protein YcgR
MRDIGSVQEGAQVNSSAMPLIEAKIQERRRHQRVKVVLPGRYMLEDRREYPCLTVDISPGGVAFAALAKGRIGERVVAYLNQIGRVEGTVTRHFDQGFAIQMKLPVLKREKLADQLTWLANRQALGMAEDRRHERIIPRFSHATLKMPDGQEYLAKLVDVSLSGAALAVAAQPPIGSAVVVGETPAQIVRHFEGGIAVEFNRPFPAEAFDENIRL